MACRCQERRAVLRRAAEGKSLRLIGDAVKFVTKTTVADAVAALPKRKPKLVRKG